MSLPLYGFSIRLGVLVFITRPPPKCQPENILTVSYVLTSKSSSRGFDARDLNRTGLCEAVATSPWGPLTLVALLPRDRPGHFGATRGPGARQRKRAHRLQIEFEV